MRIESFRVVNYKSFADSEEIHLEPGFNVIVGRNNVGKTALAEAMGLRFADKPHLSTKTVPRLGAAPANASSQAEVSIRVEADELKDMLMREIPTFYVPTVLERPGDGNFALQAALSEGATVDAVFHSNGSPLQTWLSTYTVPTPVSAYLRLTMTGKRIAAICNLASFLCSLRA